MDGPTGVLSAGVITSTELAGRQGRENAILLRKHPMAYHVPETTRKQKFVCQQNVL